MKDRYRHWHTRDAMRAMPARAIMAPRVRDLEDQVLQDLGKAQSEEEKLEILDSYSLACQRKYRNSMYEAILDIGQRSFVKLLSPFIDINLPEPQEPYHPNIGVAVASEKQQY